jgi:2-methylcitrate dehydratase PrpD
MHKKNGNLTRRRFVGTMTAVPAATALPGRARAESHEVSELMAKLSAYMSEARSRPLPERVIADTKHHVLDTLAAMISGSELPPGRHALQFANDFGGRGIASIVASSLRCGPIEAAIVNGALAQADETDDNYSAGGAHPGCAVVPAALAVGEQFGVDGMHFLRGVTLGYDVGMRAMKTILGQTVLRDTHNVVGSFGASAAAGCVADLNAQQMRWPLDYAAQPGGRRIWCVATRH